MRTCIETRNHCTYIQVIQYIRTVHAHTYADRCMSCSPYHQVVTGTNNSANHPKYTRLFSPTTWICGQLAHHISSVKRTRKQNAVQSRQLDSHVILLGHEFLQWLSSVGLLSMDIVHASREDPSGSLVGQRLGWGPWSAFSCTMHSCSVNCATV